MNVRSTEGPDVALRRFLMAGSRQVTGVASRDQDETLQSDRSRQNETTAFGTEQASSGTRGLPGGQHERQEVVGDLRGEPLLDARKQDRTAVTMAQKAVRASEASVADASSCLVISSSAAVSFLRTGRCHVRGFAVCCGHA
jgi:hypothetical protein